MSIIIHYQILSVAVTAVAQSCTMGFPSTVPQCNGCTDTGPNQAVTRIISDMNFTCTGTVTYWRAAGEYDDGGQRRTDAVLSIWRETSDNQDTYERVGGIQLGTCGNETPAPLVTGTSNVYECTLPQSERVSVQPGDIIGIEIAENPIYRFELYFTNGGGPTNYQFSGRLLSTVTLSEASVMVQEQPQISLRVEPTISTATVSIFATTQFLTTIEASSTNFSMTQVPTRSTNEGSTTDLTMTQSSTTTPTEISTTTEVSNSVIAILTTGLLTTQFTTTNLPTRQPLTTTATEAFTTNLTTTQASSTHALQSPITITIEASSSDLATTQPLTTTADLTLTRLTTMLTEALPSDFPMTQPSTTIEASTVDLPVTQLPITTTKASSMAAIQFPITPTTTISTDASVTNLIPLSPLTTEASSINFATTQPFATIRALRSTAATQLPATKISITDLRVTQLLTVSTIIVTSTIQPFASTSSNIDTIQHSSTTTEVSATDIPTTRPLTTTEASPTDFTPTKASTNGGPDGPSITQSPQNNVQIGTIAGAAVGGIIVVLLILIIVLLLVLVIRRQSRYVKFTPSNNHPSMANPAYDENFIIPSPNAEAGMVGVYSMAGAADHATTDYEDIDEKPTLPPSDVFVNPINDYSSDTPHKPIEMNTYESPVEPLPKDFTPEYSFANAGVLYVPSQEQRNSLPRNIINGDVYAVIQKTQQSESGAAPKLFEEDDTYWKPASDANELYKQLSAKKYREIVRQQIQITYHLGSGQFGTVSKGIWQSPMGAMDVAVKQLQPGASEEEKVKFLQEAAINGQFSHPNVVKLMGVVTVGEPAMIVLEMLSNGDLHNYLLKLQPSPGEILPSNTQQLLLKFCQQVASGMDYLARKAFVHRDLAARNILVADDKTCKISDFGMSRDLMDENYYVSHGGKIPIKWTAPEALHYKKYSTASDVWSFGCVMYEIWSLGHKPFEDKPNTEVVQMIEAGYRLPPPPGLPKELYKIMIQCWHPDHSSRPTFPQLVEMLSRADFELFVWEEEDLKNSDPQVKLIGAPLEVAKNLYHELQKSYMSS